MGAVTKVNHGKLSLSDPGQILEFSHTLKDYIDKNKLSITLKDNNSEKKYPLVGAWKFAGMNFGLTGIPAPPVAIHKPGEMICIMYVEEKRFGKGGVPYMKNVPVFLGMSSQEKEIEAIRLHFNNKFSRVVYRPYYNYKCDCNIMMIGKKQIISFGQGMASSLEDGKELNAEYAINSQSQTRAIGRGFKNVLEFVMTSAGFEGTPGEEMTQMKFQEADIVDQQAAMSEDEFKLAMKNLTSGKWTIEFIRENWSMSKLQEEALTIILETKS